jgi:hypothetical protein
MSEDIRTVRTFVIQVIIAILLTNFLFFIDEGFYSFQWMNNVGNWVAFALYVAVMVLFQWVTFLLIKQLYFGRFQLFVSSLLGVVLGLILLFSLL